MFRLSGRSYGNATQTIANDPDRFQIYTIVPIVLIELKHIQARTQHAAKPQLYVRTRSQSNTFLEDGFEGFVTDAMITNLKLENAPSAPQFFSLKRIYFLSKFGFG